MISAFGVDHGGHISKAQPKENFKPKNPDAPKGYRRAVGNKKINPRSNVYHKKGSLGRRVGRGLVGQYAGSAAGGAAGAGVGAGLGAAGGAYLGKITGAGASHGAKAGALVGAGQGAYGGGILGGSLGAVKARNVNRAKGDTVAYHKKTGKKSSGKSYLHGLEKY